MKTFKLVSLEMVENHQQDIETEGLSLIDGLIINREDEKNQWLIEAYMKQQYLSHFQMIKENGNSVMLYAKISKPTNKPAPFLSKIISINHIEDKMSVIFLGELVDEKKEKVENTLKHLIDQGYQGEELLEKFKKEI